jgi:hypothetical protein
MQRMTHIVRSTFPAHSELESTARITLPAMLPGIIPDTERRDTAPSPRMIRVDKEEQEE